MRVSLKAIYIFLNYPPYNPTDKHRPKTQSHTMKISEKYSHDRSQYTESN